MSPFSGGDAPQTPNRRASSSALFSAFTKLTTGRLKSTTPPPTLTTQSPGRTPVLGPTHRLHSVSSAPAASIHEDVDDGTNGHEGNTYKLVVTNNGKAVLGGPPELDDLIGQLDRSHPLSEREAAIQKLCPLLEEYPVDNILAIWSPASDLLDSGQPAGASDAGYLLLKSCVALPNLSPVERNIFFNAVLLRRYDDNFDHRLHIISTLTNGGRNVEAFESSVASFILTSLDTCFAKSLDAYQKASKARRSQAKKSVEEPIKEPIKENDNLAHLFQYAIDVAKFNSKLFSEEQLELLLDKVMDICQKATQCIDIQHSIQLLDTLITYVHIPKKSLRPCLEMLCAIYRQLEDLQEQTWNTLSNLFKSHVGQAAISALLNTLHSGANRRSKKYRVYQGASQVLQTLLLEDGRNGLPTVPISLLFPALKGSIQEQYKSHETYVMNLVAAILAEEKLRHLLLDEADWSDLVDIVHTCAGREDDRESAVSGRPLETTTSATGTGSVTTGIEAALSSSSTTGDAETELISNPDSLTAPAVHPEVARRNSDDNISQILSALNSMSTEMDVVQKASVMELFMRLASRLSDSAAENMITFYSEERYLHPSNEGWLEACRGLVSGILSDRSRPLSLRLLTIKILRDVYNTVDGLCTSDTVLQCATLLLSALESEKDVYVLQELADFAVDVADRASDGSFAQTVDVLWTRIERSQTHSPHPGTSLPMFQSRTVKPIGSAHNVIATAFVRLFIRSMNKSARKIRMLYDLLRSIASSDTCESDARLTALKLLFRLRADSNHAMIINLSSEGESLAALLHRTVESKEKHMDMNGKASEHPGQEDQASWRENRKASSGSPHSSLNRHTSRQTGGRVSKPVEPLWMYPGPSGLPEEPSRESSRVVYAHIDPAQYPLSDDLLDMQITLWLECVISLLQRSPDWEIYSYVLVHLGPQLSNQALVRSCVPQLKMMRNVICEQIRGSTFSEPPAYTSLNKSAVATCLIHILTMLISYHDHFEKSEEDELVKAFMHGIGHWTATRQTGSGPSKWCIHALTVCCHELPLSVSKSLDNIIQKMSQTITQPRIAIHILEFLTTLARMPELYRNFREDEFKLVFGVSFRYLTSTRDRQREREQDRTAAVPHGSNRNLKHGSVSRESTTSPNGIPAQESESAMEMVPQYVYSLAYHVIIFWFMGLKMEDRAKLIPWITKSLMYNSNGRQVLEEQSQVIVDMMNLVGYTDRDKTTPDPDFAKPGDGEVWRKTWIVGNSLVSIDTAARTGVSLITTRRPCATRYSYFRPMLAPAPRHQIPVSSGLASETVDSSTYVGMLPDDVFQTFYAPLAVMNPLTALTDDDATKRAIAAFDRMATVDCYKVGVIYIGEGQTDERDILMNDVGSAAYTAFLSDLGTLVRLKGAQFNTGGLDTRDDMDGEYTYCWRDRCMELVFHITTMMPTDPNDDMTYPNKKRHIGNNLVNIIFNDSGLPYNFDTFPSQFNYIHIVITPESRASFVDRRLDTDPDGRSRYYRVQIVAKPGFPDISPVAETKIICGKYLAAFCRLIAINASVFSQVWVQREIGESVSSWRNRLREIKRIQGRASGSGSDSVTASSPSSPYNSSGLASPPQKDAGGFKRSSMATFMSEGTNRSSVTSGSQHDAA